MKGRKKGVSFFSGVSTQAVSETKQSFEAECRDKNTLLKEKEPLRGETLLGG